MSANTHWTQSRSVAAKGGGPEGPGQQRKSMADPPVRPEHDMGRSPTPSSDDYDKIEGRGDHERALQCAFKAIQKKRRVAALHRQIEAERKAVEERVPLPTLTGTIRPRSDTSATMAPALKRSRRDGSDSEDDSRLRVKDPKTYEGKNQGELDTFILACERVKHEVAKSWKLKVEGLEDDYRTWSNLKEYLQNDLRSKALRAKDACSRCLQASQHQNQTVSSFVNYIDQLEKELSPIPKDMKGIRLMPVEAKADYKAKEETKPKERQGGDKATPRLEKPTTPADGRPICFNCNEPGHISKSCPKPKKDRGEGKKVSRLKGTPGQKEDKKLVSRNAVLHRRRERQEKKPYLSTAVQVRTPTGWQTLTALIDLGANENFISHLRVAELGIKPRLDEATPRVTTMDETQLQVYGVYRPRIRATDNSGTTEELHSRLPAASFTGWDIVLGWPWLKELNPDINWRDER
ncbi:MAG: hypothetical protein M1816_000398 [Peltula sp. TS41687]|nr:MAG: hypothetical protein M1816_000398 [Peltula sp. TS41687]